MRLMLSGAPGKLRAHGAGAGRSVPARTVLTVLGIVLAVAALLKLLWIAHQVLTWVVIAVFLALALDPLVNLFIRLGIRRRGLAIAATFFLLAIVAFALGATFIPTLVGEINDFIDAVLQYVTT